MTDEVVTKLYRALVEELRRRGHPGSEPITVADLYEELVPYRAVRARLGVELNADYEDALLRLLAGERGLLRLEPGDARDELRQEVASPYPTVGLFRKFSASRVWVSLPGHGEEPELPTAEGPGAPPPGVSDAAFGGEEAIAEGEPGPAPGAGRVCGACGVALPGGDPVRFCPGCGEDQEGRCPGCGAAVERGWRYCVHCGAELAAGS